MSRLTRDLLFLALLLALVALIGWLRYSYR